MTIQSLLLRKTLESTARLIVRGAEDMKSVAAFVEQKRPPLTVVRTVKSRLLYVDYITERGRVAFTR